MASAYVRVQAAFRRAPQGQQLGEPKARSRRTVPLPEQCVDALRQHAEQQAVEAEAAGPAWTSTGFVFTSPTGQPLSDKTVTAWFGRLRAKAEVEHGRLYDLRHTAARLLLAQGVHPRVIMEVLGHSTFRLTMDTYAHVMPAGLQEAARAMNAALIEAQRTVDQSTRADNGPNPGNAK